MFCSPRIRTDFFGQVDAVLRASIEGVCGSDFAQLDTACCTTDQVTALAMNLAQAEPLIATCPACRNNFRRFYCSFTCSPHQSTFVDVTGTQKAKDEDGKEHDAVASLDFYVDPKFGQGFFDSCREVKFGATNGYAMDLIGGGAKTWGAFLRYMGQKRPGLGSPFQIDFPTADSPSLQGLQYPFASNDSFTPLSPKILSCSASSLDARCACPDCSAVCTSLPPPPPPFIETSPQSICHVGEVRCGSFALILIYSIGLVAFLALTAYREIATFGRLRKSGGRRTAADESGYESAGYERVNMQDPGAGAGPNDPSAEEDGPLRPSEEGSQPPVAEGAETGSRSGGSMSSFYSRSRTGRGVPPGASEADYRALGAHHQPRSYALNVLLTRAFYRLGYFCASWPYLTIAIGLVICGLLNAGWARFEVERDPVQLWVAKGTRSEVEKSDFERRFGPFYRTEQVFFTAAEGDDQPVLSWERLQWIAAFEQEVRSLASPSGLTLASVCTAPTADTKPPTSSSDCVIQSIMGYFDNSLDGTDADSWAETLNDCATNPAACLPPFGQPLNPRLLLGGVPGYSGKLDNETEGDTVRASEARSVVITFVVDNSLNRTAVHQAEEWEEVLKTYFGGLAGPEGRANKEAGLRMSWTTEISLEGELNKSTNTDVPIVVLSYLVMFVYVSINLGGSGAAILSAIAHGFKALARLVLPKQFATSTPSTTPIFQSFDQQPRRSTSLKRRLLVESKFVLALWSIVIVLLSVSTSVGLFSLLGVKITLIIAEVIPFLVLAIGVDNVFILAHELSRQNSKAYSAMSRSGAGFAEADGDDYDEDEIGGLPSPAERVAKALGRMGPSILLSAACETVAFALGAIVGMPAVRNFAIYAAGAVAINTLLQITILVSAMAIDLRRVESNRIDCFPCAKLPAITQADMARAQGEGNLAIFIRTIYAPFLLKRPVKIFVVAVFSGLFVLSLIGTQHVNLGLGKTVPVW